jgi:hypothetical protein
MGQKLDWECAKRQTPQRCARLSETLPMLQHDSVRPEDVLKMDANHQRLQFSFSDK